MDHRNTRQDDQTEETRGTQSNTENQGGAARTRRRRQVLAGVAALGTAGVAGCLGQLSDEPEPGLIGSGRAGRPDPGGTPIEELPDLRGELTVYSGRNQFLVGGIEEHLRATYNDLDLEMRYAGSTEHVNAILTEGSGTPADVFFSVNSGSLGALVDAGRTRSLSGTVRETVREEFRTGEWVGTSGRSRTIPYNTDAYDEGDLPTDILAYEEFDGQLGWAPAYGSCQAFVTAMRLLEGEQRTQQWVEAVVDNGIQAENNEFAVCQAIANGELDAGFTNHYYIQRVLAGDPDAPIATTFTDGDAGAVFNVAGATVIDEADNPELAENFIRHLLSAEVQEYFAVETFEYPMVSGVDPVGELPTIDELDVPDIDLTELSDLEATVDLMREAGAQV
jgi:iron(III) transport system substrate-binding protein